MKLPRQQLAVLEAVSADEWTTVDALTAQVDEKPATVTGAAFALEEEGLAEVRETTEQDPSLTEEGETYVETGLPEVRLYEAALDRGADEDPVEMGAVIEAADLDGPLVDIALSNFARKGYGEIEGGKVTANPDADPDGDEEAAALAALAAGKPVDDEAVLESLVRRDLVELDERTARSVRLTDEGVTELMAGVEVREAVDRLTPQMLATGEWRDAEFAEYNVAADAATPNPGKVHVLRQAAERVKEVLVGMGFEEMEGPHVDADFWINDCLFMPQDHPARTHWDRFALETPAKIDELPNDLVERVERAHREGVGPDSNGYNSPWDVEFAKELALRGHTTSLSARYLSGEQVGDLEPPQRYFSVEKAYRNDTLDATHLLEFFQIEGWVMAEDLTVRDLMGTFTEFYSRFDITDLRFKPTYNPYTEPSFELFGRHPETNELIEIGNSGIFRPEMLDPLGVDADVMAWGLALERLLMLITGFEDIRDVHGTLTDLEFLRSVEVEY
ncbi:phenylalanine--tRNA ligase subunit alpha [Halanaeroarchaeum sulfurireducens]|uniref:Phenylalanine--tRNA ligase alpha subunit n=1 Tax=Halanaeroarchaeum sulfurireducens TaxID=1604004 RepID=A0A0F7PE53_9EURY|nr:phenylalanine--tRNA ligase subunit alpha [Halanaeroarchaeum sulfurireducens]AKH98490.1 phenylalanyl-tRNA synthetase subunit alpha [Halanaeroarchaeum sulfurireducens]